MLKLNFNPFPKLETERLILDQPLTEDDKALFELRSDERVMRYIDRPRAKTINDAKELLLKIQDAINKNDGITWALRSKTSPFLIGTIGYWRIDKENFRAEIGYMLHPGFQGRGIMQEAMEKVLSYGFKELNFHSIEAQVNIANAASIKLLESKGFIQEGYFRENYYYEGRFLDTAIYSLLTRD